MAFDRVQSTPIKNRSKSRRREYRDDQRNDHSSNQRSRSNHRNAETNSSFKKYDREFSTNKQFKNFRVERTISNDQKNNNSSATKEPVKLDDEIQELQFIKTKFTTYQCHFELQGKKGMAKKEDPTNVPPVQPNLCHFGIQTKNLEHALYTEKRKADFFAKSTKKENEHLTIALNAEKSRYEELQKSYESKSADLTESKTKVSELNSKVDKYSEKITKLEDENEELFKDSSILEAEVTEFKTKMKFCERQSIMYKSDAKRFKIELDECQKEAENAKAIAKKALTEKETATTKLRSFQEGVLVDLYDFQNDFEKDNKEIMNDKQATEINYWTKNAENSKKLKSIIKRIHDRFDADFPADMKDDK